MRILYVVHGFPPDTVGGVELQCHALATALAGSHAVGVLAWQSDASKPDYALEAGRQGALEVWRLNHLFTDLASFSGVYQNARIDALYDGVLEQWRPDVVHVQHLIGLSTGILERTKRRGIPLVLTLHDYWFGCPKGQRIRDPLVVCHEIDRQLCVTCLKPQNYELRAPRSPLGRWLRSARLPSRRRGLRILRQYDADMHRLLALPDAIVTPSRFHREMYGRYGLDLAKAHVLPCGLATASFAGMARPPAGHFRVGFLGTLIPSKGAHVLLEAYRLLGRPDVTLDFHGPGLPYHGDTGYRARLEAAAATIPGTIRFHGRYDPGDVPRIIASLDALVVPSLWYESFSLVVREGFLAGVPVVAAGHGAMAEAIEHGVSGLLFTPGDPADLARQLARLLEEPGLRERLGRHPHGVASIEEVAARHLDLYTSLGNRGG